jgi:hypothetical protein
VGGLTSLDSVYIAIAFIVPGFVFSAVRNQFVTGQERQGSEQVVRFLTYSTFNYALFSGIIYLVLENYSSALVRATLWFFVILIGPAVSGIVSGASIQRDWSRKLFHRLKLYPVHVVPSAWDYKFARMEVQWVLVVLKNDIKFGGLCGKQSFASSDKGERDLYIEQVYDIDDTNKWIATSKSLLISAGEIRTIEFWPLSQEKNDEQERSNTHGVDSNGGEQGAPARVGE